MKINHLLAGKKSSGKLILCYIQYILDEEGILKKEVPNFR
jgi:hypothetical protein